MDWQTIINVVAVIATTLGGVLGWYVNAVFTAQKELKAELLNVMVELPSYYVRKDELRNMITDLRNDNRDAIVEMRDLLKQILAELDQKMNR